MPQHTEGPSAGAALSLQGLRMKNLPLGKLPIGLLSNLLERHRTPDPRVLLGPGIGLDCAVIDYGERLLVAKSDPITFTAQDLGWYAIHVNANDVATAGARPRWFLATLLLPDDNAEEALVEVIFQQIHEACRELGVALIGGHTEITSGIDRPILAGTMLGEVARERLITPRGAQPGDRILLTKGIPIEAASILAREYATRLTDLPKETIARAREYLHNPGISVVAEAMAGSERGGVSAMHDPTEGGLASGLWELVLAADVGLEVDKAAIPILPEAAAICDALDVDPMEAIASGALLLTVRPKSIMEVTTAIEAAGIEVSQIGQVTTGHRVMIHSEGALRPLPHPPRDALAQLFERDSS
jgi:hydrogenase expression/formation protein HypE